MGLVAPLMATVLALAAPSTHTGERAVALLSDNRLIELALPSGKIVVRRRLGPKPLERITAGRFLAAARDRLFVLVSTGSGSDSIAVLDLRTGKRRATYALEPGVRYRGIVLAGELIYAYGGRLGDEIDKTNHLREQSGVLTRLDAADGERRLTVTVRPANGHMWWIYWGAARDDASSVVLSYHGGCYPDATELCTSGADWVDAGGTLRFCQAPASQSGCLAEAHGMIEPYGVGWIATTGGESLVQYGQRGNILRTLHTGLRRDHVMNVAFNADRSRLYVLSSCLYGRDGLRRVSLSGGLHGLYEPRSAVRAWRSPGRRLSCGARTQSTYGDRKPPAFAARRNSVRTCSTWSQPADRRRPAGRVQSHPTRTPLSRSSEAGKESYESTCPHAVAPGCTVTTVEAPAGTVLLDADALRRTLSRIAHEIIEANPDLTRVALVGIQTRGVPLAHRLRRLIEERAGAAPDLGAVDITFYRDDVQVRSGAAPRHSQPVVRSTALDFPLEGKTVVLVDDVLYTGRTIRAAIEALFDYGRPERIQLAVLVDRGHRELPIRPDYVGKNLPTSRDERIQVQLVEVDEVDRILLVPAPEEAHEDG